MEVRAVLRNLRISPRKVRLVAGLIKGASLAQARQQLTFSAKASSEPMLKLLNSAAANATHNFNIDETTIKVKEIRVDQGKTIKRYMPRAFGRATLLRKRASHITLVVEGEQSSKPAKKEKTEKKAKKKEVNKAIPKGDSVAKKVKKEVRARGRKEQPIKQTGQK